jgi:hypothetical protein
MRFQSFKWALVCALVVLTAVPSLGQLKVRAATAGFTSAVVKGGPFGIRAAAGEAVSGLMEGSTVKIGNGFWYADADAKLPESIESIPTGPGEIPDRFDLDQNYPNPFNPVTSIVISLPKRSRVRLEVYNILGQLVNVLVDEELLAGKHRVEWDARDATGRQMSSGVYLYRFVADDFSATKTMTLLK